MSIAGRDQLILFRDSDRHGLGDRALQRGARRGVHTRLRSGAYVPTALWATLRAEDRRRIEAAAMAELHPGFRASHRSAAALWRIPSVLRHDGLVHSRVSMSAGSRTEHGVRKHAVHDPDLHLDIVEGITVTTIERTALDLAASEPFHEAVVAMDGVLKMQVTKERLREVLDEWAPKQRRGRIEKVIEFADVRSGSPGESWSRVQIHEGGLPAPVLQERFFDSHGFIGDVDFWWPHANLIGEFDGLKKYREAAMLAGRTAGEVVEQEKIREDRLRASATHPVVDRWIWATLLTRGELVGRLRAAGLH